MRKLRELFSFKSNQEKEEADKKIKPIIFKLTKDYVDTNIFFVSEEEFVDDAWAEIICDEGEAKSMTQSQ